MATPHACGVCGRNLLGRTSCPKHPEAGTLALDDPEDRAQARLLRELALERWDRAAGIIGVLAVWMVGTIVIQPKAGPWLEGPMAGLAMLGFALPMVAGCVLVMGRLANPGRGWWPVPGPVVLGWAGASVGGGVLLWMIQAMALRYWSDDLYWFWWPDGGMPQLEVDAGAATVVMAMLGAVLLLLGTGALLGRWTARAVG
jgi:hypothetical protein